MDSDPSQINQSSGAPSSGQSSGQSVIGQPLGQSGQQISGSSGHQNMDAKTDDLKSEVSGGENSQEPIYEETDSNDRQSGSQETQKGTRLPMFKAIEESPNFLS